MSDTHKIERGDTLSGIATSLGVTVEQLLAVNPNITDPDKIYAGQAINLPTAPQVKQPVTQQSTTQFMHQSNKPLYYFPHIRKVEGDASLPYQDTNGHWTVGHGHKFSKDSPEIFTEAGFTPEDYAAIKAGTRSMSLPDQKRLALVDIKRKMNSVTKVVPRFQEFNPDMKQALLDAEYRGDLRLSPKAVGFINEDKFPEASVEYMNFQEARDRESIRKRMQGNADAFAEAYYMPSPPKSSTPESPPSKSIGGLSIKEGYGSLYNSCGISAAKMSKNLRPSPPKPG